MAALTRPVASVPVVATAAIDACKCVTFGGATGSTLGTKVIGISTYSVSAGEAADVVYLGQVKAKNMSTTIVPGDNVTCSTSGDIVVSGTATDWIVGQSLGYGASGDMVELLLGGKH